jgi:hypothetical protein
MFNDINRDLAAGQGPPPELPKDHPMYEEYKNHEREGKV